MQDILTAGFRELGLTPPPGAIDTLCQYSELLLEQNKVMNLTAITQPEQVARLHFLDSAAVLAWGDRAGLEPAPTEGLVADTTWLAGKSLIDVGTGAGFPGLVLKILEPSLRLTLADSLGKRVNFLQTVCDALHLTGAEAVHARAEEFAASHRAGFDIVTTRAEELSLEVPYRDGFDVATSRAVAAFPALCELCLPFVKVGGQFIAMKSVDSAAEVQAGEKAVKTLGGRLSAPVDYPVPGAGVTHRLVVVDKVFPTPRGYPRSWGKIKKAPL